VHDSDLVDLYGGSPIETALINFVNYLDPNGGSGNQWPKWTLKNPKNFVFGPGGATSVQDDVYREAAISAVNIVMLAHPI
jgi:carboxylesterase type B